MRFGQALSIGTFGNVLIVVKNYSERSLIDAKGSSTVNTKINR